MGERNLLDNGRFLVNLSGWDLTGTPTFSVGDGDDHYGVAALDVGDAIEQSFAVPHARQYTLHLSLKCASIITAGQVTAVLTDGDGNTVKTIQPAITVAATWTENETMIGLVPGATYVLTLTNVSAAAQVKLDDVWIYYVPFTRAQLAAQVHTRLGRLASERSLSVTASGVDTEGDYTQAVDTGLRAVNAINDETDLPDVRWLEASNVDAALDAIQTAMLQRLALDYAAEVDVTIGPRSERLSQKAEAIRQALGSGGQAAGGAGRIQQRPLRHTMADDYRV